MYAQREVAETFQLPQCACQQPAGKQHTYAQATSQLIVVTIKVVDGVNDIVLHDDAINA